MPERVHDEVERQQRRRRVHYGVVCGLMAFIGLFWLLCARGGG